MLGRRGESYFGYSPASEAINSTVSESLSSSFFRWNAEVEKMNC